MMEKLGVWERGIEEEQGERARYTFRFGQHLDRGGRMARLLTSLGQRGSHTGHKGAFARRRRCGAAIPLTPPPPPRAK